jgi:hypothetical protein
VLPVWTTPGQPERHLVNGLVVKAGKPVAPVVVVGCLDDAAA